MNTLDWILATVFTLLCAFMAWLVYAHVLSLLAGAAVGVGLMYLAKRRRDRRDSAA